MKISLMIEASPATLAKILAAMPDDDGTVTIRNDESATIAAFSGNNTTPPPHPHAAAPVPLPVPPVQNSGDDDDGDTTPNADAPALDVNGLPWDERIHAGTKGINKDGSWKKRKGVGPETIALVETELRAHAATNTTPVATLPVMPQPVAGPVPMPAPQPVAQPVTIAQPPVPAPMPMPAPAPAPVPMPAPEASAPPAPESVDFHGFMQRVSIMTGMKGDNGLPLVDAAYLADLTARVAQAYQTPLSVITDLAAPDKAHMVTYAAQLMQHDGRWR